MQYCRGIGAGADAISGLGRAFFYAGARALLVTHWPVESTSARQLTTATFKRQAADPKLARAEALRQSMLELIDGPGYLDPDTKGRFLLRASGLLGAVRARGRRTLTHPGQARSSTGRPASTENRASVSIARVALRHVAHHAQRRRQLPRREFGDAVALALGIGKDEVRILGQQFGDLAVAVRSRGDAGAAELDADRRARRVRHSRP